MGRGALWREGSAAVRDDTWAQARDNELSLTIGVHTRASFSAHSLFALRFMQPRPGAVPGMIAGTGVRAVRGGCERGDQDGA